MSAFTIAVYTVREVLRRRFAWALAGVTFALIALSAWALHAAHGSYSADQLSDPQAALARDLLTTEVLGLFMFAVSLTVALCVAFLAGPSIAGETDSGVALAVLARPVGRGAVLIGKWLGLVAFSCGFTVLAASLQLTVGYATAGLTPPHPVTALALLCAETVTLLTFTLLLSTLMPSMAASLVSIGLFVVAWVAGLVAFIGATAGSTTTAQIGVVARVLLPTDGLWRGATAAFRRDTLLDEITSTGGWSMISGSAVTPAYLGWVALWILVALAVSTVSFGRRDI